MRIPLKFIAKEPPRDGQTWRMNFDRTYFGYNWSAWSAGGGLNDARVGGNVTFESRAAAVRILATDALLDGLLKLQLELANPTGQPQKVKLGLKCAGEQEPGKGAASVGSDEKEVTVEPGKATDVVLGRGERLLRHNRLVLDATDQAGRRLFLLERDVQIPAPRFVKRPAPKVPLVYVFPRFLPSLERLAVIVDYTAWAKKTGHAGPPQWLLLGNGHPGEKPHLDNVISQHFSPAHPVCSFFSDLLIGRD